MKMPGNKPEYKILYSSDVIKTDLPKLDNKIKSIVKRKIEQLKHNPYLGLPLRGKLAKFYKLKVSKYRVVYEVNNNNLIIIVIAIGKRDNLFVYKIAEKRI